MFKKIKNWFVPEHVGTRFMYFYGVNLKVCEILHKQHPLENINDKG